MVSLSTRGRAFTALLAPTLCATAGAQTFTVLVKDLDPIAGVGAVTSIDDCEVNDNGTTLVKVDTDFTPSPGDGVVLVNGIQFARETDPLVSGNTISSFGQAFLDDSDRVTWNLNIVGTPDSGIFRDLGAFQLEGAISTAPQFSASTPYVGYFGVRNDGANRLVVMASVDDPAIASSVDRALVIFTVDNAGNLLSESVLAKEGDIIGSSALTVADFSTDRSEFDINRSGQVLYLADTTAATNDGLLMLDAVQLIREGDASPFGRNWELLLDRQVSLNDNGDYVFKGNFDGTTTDDDVICVNNTTIIAQEGSSLPSIAGGFTLTGFGSGALEIDNSGNVFWWGDWNNPNTLVDNGIFRNGDLIVEEGVTMIAGHVVTALPGVADNFNISPDGRYLIFECTLASVGDAAVLIDFGGPSQDAEPFCFGDGTLTDHTTPCPCGNNGAPGNGCGHSFDPNGANLAATGTTVADDIVLHSSFEPVSSFTLFMQHANPGDTTFHDGVLCAGNPLIRLRGRPAVAGEAFFPNSNFAQDSTTTLSIRGGTFPGSGATMRYAAWYRNASSTFCPPATANVTNGLVVTW